MENIRIFFPVSLDSFVMQSALLSTIFLKVELHQIHYL